MGLFLLLFRATFFLTKTQTNMLISILSDKLKDRQVPARLYVLRSGDFIVLPSGYSIDFKKQVFKSARCKPLFSWKTVSVGVLPLTDSFILFTTLLAWLVRKKWRFTPRTATRFRNLLTSNGFNLVYLRDDTYRVSFWRSTDMRVKFYRELPTHSFTDCDYSKLNYTIYSGFCIFFSPKSNM